MKRTRWISLAVAFAVAAMAFMVAGASAAITTDPGYSIDLTLTPNQVQTDPGVTLTGTYEHGTSGVGFMPVFYAAYPTANCSGPAMDYGFVDWTSHSSGTKGDYEATIDVNQFGDIVPGMYSLQTFTGLLWTYAESDCQQLLVGLTGKPLGPSGPDHYGYCSVAGNTDPNTGQVYGVNTFLSLHQGQPAEDEHFTGATPAFWVEGTGITCDLTPAQQALAAASTVKVNHVGQTTPDEGPPFYTFVPAP